MSFNCHDKLFCIKKFSFSNLFQLLKVVTLKAQKLCIIKMLKYFIQKSQKRHDASKFCTIKFIRYVIINVLINIDINILKCVYPKGGKVKSRKGSAHMTEHKSDREEAEGE